MRTVPTPEFVNRAEELDQVRRILNTIRLGRTIFETILEWYGVPGIGKTTLGQMIADLCQDMQVPFARVDFNPQENQRAPQYAEDPILILEDIIISLAIQEPVDFREALQAYNQTQDPFLRKKEAGKVIESFLAYVKELLEKPPVVLLFDTTDRASSETLSWLEEKILSPLCLTGKCLIIWTGRFPRTWERFEVRRRVISNKLGPLPPKATQEQVGPIGLRIYPFTRGHPMGNEEVAAVVLKYQERGQEAPELELINALVDKVIDKYVMEGIAPELNAALRVLAVVRQFDVAFLRQLLSRFVAEFRDAPDVYFLDILSQLKSTYLVEWDRIRRGYTVDPTLRRILALHMRYNQPERFLQINKEAAAIYAGWIEKVSENRTTYILEKLYHEATLASAEKRPAQLAISTFQRELKGYLNAYYTDKDKDSIRRSVEQLRQEMKLDEELRELIGDKGHEALLTVIEEHLQKIEKQGD